MTVIVFLCPEEDFKDIQRWKVLEHLRDIHMDSIPRGNQEIDLPYRTMIPGEILEGIA